MRLTAIFSLGIWFYNGYLLSAKITSLNIDWICIAVLDVGGLLVLASHLEATLPSPAGKRVSTEQVFVRSSTFNYRGSFPA